MNETDTHYGIRRRINSENAYIFESKHFIVCALQNMRMYIVPPIFCAAY
jgi:hypothetical protein